ncbi:hypothetical protein BRAD285_0653 [Bradyrhizobium sp. ORS 285]|uniref:hypothetical protein n=1 Tax=Bradyrhizobium sp. ORS 285 TaxID=115808 RepID=UPI00024084BB|nr:hypothetical protein [Bradyrhizobium sp. ORS 285]CCD89115.1 hypothetical protein BRAO285_560005 [Bradyrhizobium sp. ORS 285]SMX55943.1 hypothetical protein BRAD285_0653 [Bradyrhizobium sp. ORS 285]
MLKAIGLIVHTIWAVCAMATGTFVGVAVGLHSGGWIGAVALGIVGLIIGALAAAFPLETIGLILEGL